MQLVGPLFIVTVLYTWGEPIVMLYTFDPEGNMRILKLRPMSEIEL